MKFVGLCFVLGREPSRCHPTFALCDVWKTRIDCSNVWSFGRLPV